jgi:hypothetical protein
LDTKKYAPRILKTAHDSRHRICQTFDESVVNLIVECPALPKEDYVERHGRVCAQLQFNVDPSFGYWLCCWCFVGTWYLHLQGRSLQDWNSICWFKYTGKCGYSDLRDMGGDPANGNEFSRTLGDFLTRWKAVSFSVELLEYKAGLKESSVVTSIKTDEHW